MKCLIIVALVLVGISISESSTLSRDSVPIRESFSTLYRGAWLEKKEKRNNVKKYLMLYGVSGPDSQSYARGPITMECIRVTEEGYKVTGIQPNGVAYNTTITYNKEAKRPYQSLGQDYEFDAEVYKDKYSRNVMRFNAYSKANGSLVFYTLREFIKGGEMRYSHTNVENGVTAFTVYTKWE
nr:uncharacterized protein LOC121131123 [Lepeophtheirus salmonis]